MATIEDNQQYTAAELVLQKRDRDGAQPKRMFWAYVWFFLLGIGLPLSYSSILFQTDYFAKCLGYGAGFVRTAFAAFNLPALPIFFIQNRYDRLFDEKYGTRIVTIFRVAVCQIGMAIPVLILPFSSQSTSAFVITMVVGGLANGAGFSTLSGLASSFTPKCMAFLLIGVGAATFLLLILSVSVGSAICDSSLNIIASSRATFFGVSIIFILLPILWIICLFRCEPGRYYSAKRDRNLNPSYRQFDDEDNGSHATNTAATGHEEDRVKNMSEPFLVSSEYFDRVHNNAALEEMDAPQETAIQGLLRVSKVAKWPLLLAFFFAFPSYICYPLYPYFQGPTFFTANIFYLDSVAAFVGRQFTLGRKGRILRTHSIAFFFTLARSLAGCIFFFAIVAAGTHVTDGIFMIIFFLWGVSNGYLGTLPYSFAASYFDNENDKSQINLALNITFTLATYGSALWNFVVTPAITGTN